ncbi:MAG: LemA family protein [Gammaproteobacteria bacterium]
MIATLVFLALVGVLFAYAITIYNGLVTLRENVKKAWANIDVLLRQRHEEIPKLIETCKQYMGYEQETLEKVMEARARVSSAQASGDVGALGKAEGQLRMGLGNLFAVAEQYPELKANESFQHLQTRISTLEESIADRREFYNESVNQNNIRIAHFPDLIIANFFKFDGAELLEFTDEELTDVNVKELFGN